MNTGYGFNQNSTGYGFNQNSMKEHMVWSAFHGEESNFFLVSEARLEAKQHPYEPRGIYGSSWKSTPPVLHFCEDQGI